MYHCAAHGTDKQGCTEGEEATSCEWNRYAGVCSGRHAYRKQPSLAYQPDYRAWINWVKQIAEAKKRAAAVHPETLKREVALRMANARVQQSQHMVECLKQDIERHRVFTLFGSTDYSVVANEQLELQLNRLKELTEALRLLTPK
jgi:hypothetical protein